MADRYSPTDLAFEAGSIWARARLDQSLTVPMLSAPLPHRTEILDAIEAHWDRSRLYYEAHINFDHPNDLQRTIVDEIARTVTTSMVQWRQATFEMHKEGVPTGFLTGRSISLVEMRASLTEVLGLIKRHTSLIVLRYKIEDTLLDSKHGDTL